MSKTVYFLQIKEEIPIAFTTQRAVMLYLDGYIKAAMEADGQWAQGICMGSTSDLTQGDKDYTGSAGGPHSLFAHLWESYAKDGILNAYFTAKTEHHGNRQCSPHGGMYSEMMWTKPGAPFSLTEVVLLNRNEAQWFKDFGTRSDFL